MDDSNKEGPPKKKQKLNQFSLPNTGGSPEAKLQGNKGSGELGGIRTRTGKHKKYCVLLLNR